MVRTKGMISHLSLAGHKERRSRRLIEVHGSSQSDGETGSISAGTDSEDAPQLGGINDRSLQRLPERNLRTQKSNVMLPHKAL